jgi:hypothetical protein
MDDLELARTVALHPTLNPSKPGVQLLERCPRPCPVQHDHDSGMRKEADCGCRKCGARAVYEGAEDRTVYIIGKGCLYARVI